MRSKEIFQGSAVHLQTLHAIAVTVEVFYTANGSDVKIDHLRQKLQYNNVAVSCPKQLDTDVKNNSLKTASV